MILSGRKTIVGLWSHFLRSSDGHDLPHRRPLRHPLQQPQPPQCHQCDAVWFGLSIAVFFNLFWFAAPCKTEKKYLRHPYLAKMTIWGTLGGKRTKKVLNSIFGGTPATSSRHPCVPRHPGWESLVYCLTLQRVSWDLENSNFDSLQNKQHFLGKGLRNHNI